MIKLKILLLWPFAVVACALLTAAALTLWPLALFIGKPNPQTSDA